ncbi:MAG: hypothetical protein WAW36_01100 [Methylovulum miyakonense]|uniref:hypothetical protein n=1 Tax=Methylovulum miyakonense TaxID=645578 RepID=UPI003BB79C2F
MSAEMTAADYAEQMKLQSITERNERIKTWLPEFNARFYKTRHVFEAASRGEHLDDGVLEMAAGDLTTVMDVMLNCSFDMSDPLPTE